MDEALIKILAGMKRWEDDKSYYALTLTATEDRRIYWHSIGHWVGFTEDTPPREIRQSSLVKPDRMASIWTELEEPFVVINDERAFAVYLQLGGHALVDQDIALRWLPEVVGPCPVVQIGPTGFTSLDGLSRDRLQHAPSPKVRMRVIKRDGYRCKICGRSPANNVDIELHVHHIRPWATGGITDEENLITLCHTCHKGLHPHEDLALFDLVTPLSDYLAKSRSDLAHGIRSYRELVSSLDEADKSETGNAED